MFSYTASFTQHIKAGLSYPCLH